MPMDEQRIRNMIKQEVANQNLASKFQLTPVSRHAHNGVDAPFILNPNANYIGIILSSETPAVLPNGWKVEKTGTGVTEITHNLGERVQTAWFATCYGLGGATLPVPTVFNASNYVIFSWFDANASGAAVDASFMFLGVQVNNKSDTSVKYDIKT